MIKSTKFIVIFSCVTALIVSYSLINIDSLMSPKGTLPFELKRVFDLEIILNKLKRGDLASLDTACFITLELYSEYISIISGLDIQIVQNNIFNVGDFDFYSGKSFNGESIMSLKHFATRIGFPSEYLNYLTTDFNLKVKVLASTFKLQH